MKILISMSSFVHSDIGFGLSQLIGDKYSLVGGYRSGNSKPGATRCKFEIFKTSDLSSEKPNSLGFCELYVTNTDKFDVEGLINIEIKAKKKGVGSSVVRALVSFLKHDLNLYDIQASATDFWIKMGATTKDGEALTLRTRGLSHQPKIPYK